MPHTWTRQAGPESRFSPPQAAASFRQVRNRVYETDALFACSDSLRSAFLFNESFTKLDLDTV